MGAWAYSFIVTAVVAVGVVGTTPAYAKGGTPRSSTAAKSRAPSKPTSSNKSIVSKKGASSNRALSNHGAPPSKKAVPLKRAIAKNSSTLIRNVQRAPASQGFGGNKEVDKPLQVSGQTRNLSMMLVLKSEKDKIHFGEIRTHYRIETQKTFY